MFLLDNMSSVEVYSECRLEVSLADGQNRIFNRCLIELRQFDIGEYALRTIDLNNNKSVRLVCDRIFVPNVSTIGHFQLPTYSS